MKLDPGFINHWKTERLIEQLGSEGVVAVLRLWSKAQISREWKSLPLTPRRLALETKWKSNEEHLFSVLTDPDAPWLDKEEDGTFSIHGFEEHQKQVIHLWSAARTGGRKRKAPADEENKDTSSSTYSSSYPVCRSNEDHLVSEEPASLPEMVSSGRRFPDHSELIGKINGLRTEWARPAHWSGSEMHALHESLAQFHELTEADWQLLKRFLSAQLDRAAGYWQPVNRSKFVDTFSDVFSSAQRWATKTGALPQPKKLEGGWK